MAHMLSKDILPESEFAEVFNHFEQCEWGDCRHRASWEVTPRIPGRYQGPNGSLCTRHARLVINKINRAHATPPTDSEPS